MHVLIVDDDATFRYVLSTHLARSGHQVTLAEKGMDGHRIAHKERPDLIILDYRLPDVDGLTVAEWIRESALMAETPVILLTGAEPGEITSDAIGPNIAEVLIKQSLTEEKLDTAIDNAMLSHLSGAANQRSVLFPGE